MRTDRQADEHTDTLITILRAPTGNEVTIAGLLDMYYDRWAQQMSRSYG